MELSEANRNGEKRMGGGARGHAPAPDFRSPFQSSWLSQPVPTLEMGSSAIRVVAFPPEDLGQVTECLCPLKFTCLSDREGKILPRPPNGHQQFYKREITMKTLEDFLLPSKWLT